MSADALDQLGVDPEPWLPGTSRLSLPPIIDAPQPGPFEETGLRYRSDPCHNDDAGNGHGDSAWSSDSADDDSGTALQSTVARPYPGPPREVALGRRAVAGRSARG